MKPLPPGIQQRPVSFVWSIVNCRKIIARTPNLDARVLQPLRDHVQYIWCLHREGVPQKQMQYGSLCREVAWTCRKGGEGVVESKKFSDVICAWPPEALPFLSLMGAKISGWARLSFKSAREGTWFPSWWYSRYCLTLDRIGSAWEVCQAYVPDF